MKVILMLVLQSLLGVPSHALSSNPLLAPWPGDHGGLPPFDQIKDSDFPPALEFGFAEQRANIKKITDEKAPATFKNTIEAFELSDPTLRDIGGLFGTWSLSLASPEFEQVEKEAQPKFAKLSSEIGQNPELFARVRAVYEGSENLTPEQKKVTLEAYKFFVRQGGLLNAEQKKRVAAINERLAVLQPLFDSNLSADSKAELVIDKADAKLLEGVPEEILSGAATATGWAIGGSRANMEQIFGKAHNRSLRERAYKMMVSRGDRGNQYDNNKIVSEIVDLRNERSRILGSDSFADWRVADMMAQKPQVVKDLLKQILEPAKNRVHEQIAEMQAIVNHEGGGFKIEAWDYSYYAAKLRKEKYDFSLDQLKPYLEAKNVIKAMYHMAERLYGLKFEPLPNAPVYNSTMSVNLVKRADGTVIGIWIFDPFTSKTKRDGAWMLPIRSQGVRNGVRILPIVTNNSNIIPPKPGERSLMTLDDAVTMFHEFGHGLHGLLSQVIHQSLAGPNGGSDFIELHSQFHEHFLTVPEILKFLVDENGQPMPQSLIDKLKAAENFDEGFAITSQLASTIADLELHLSKEKNIDIPAFEKKIISEYGIPTEVGLRHRLPHFSHLFSGEEYASSYFGYIWSSVLEYDAVEAFTETGDPFNPEMAAKFEKEILAVGNTIEAADAYRNFRGRDASCEPLLRGRGLL